MTLPTRRVARASWPRHGLSRHGLSPGERMVAEEAAVVFTYNGCSHAVMMATPQDLRDFALGFSLTEETVTAAEQIESLEIIPGAGGIELRMWIAASQSDALNRRRRHLAGPTGCGLCGLESLEQATRAPRRVTSDLQMPANALAAAMAALSAHQPLNAQTHALHAAAFWQPGRGLIAVREDVGRHNALDKLAGALAWAGTPASSGAILLTSRVSVELVQKAAIVGAPIIAAVSAPTAMAVRACDAAGITLVGVARDDGFEVFSHRWRIGARSRPRGAQSTALREPQLAAQIPALS